MKGRTGVWREGKIWGGKNRYVGRRTSGWRRELIITLYIQLSQKLNKSEHLLIRSIKRVVMFVPGRVKRHDNTTKTTTRKIPQRYQENTIKEKTNCRNM